MKPKSGLGDTGRLVILTWLPAAHGARLAFALPRGTRIHRVGSWTELRRAHALLPDAVVVDPLMCNAATDSEAVFQGIAACASLIVYTSVTPAAMRRLIQLPTLLGAQLVLFGLDDTPETLRAVFRAVGLAAHHRRAFHELESRTRPLPRDVARALSGLMTDGGRLSVAELARAAHMSVRTLQRRLATAAGPSPVALIRTARAHLARELLCGSPLTVEEVAHRVGYSKVNSFRGLVRWAFNSTPSRLRRA